MNLVAFFIVPKLGKLFNLSLLDQTGLDFLLKVVKESVKLRRNNPELKRNDMIDVLIETLREYEVSKILLLSL